MMIHEWRSGEWGLAAISFGRLLVLELQLLALQLHSSWFRTNSGP